MAMSLTKEALLPIMQNYLTASASQPSTMQETQQQLLQYANQPGFAASMAEIVRDQQNQPSPVRQLAAIMLHRHVVEKRWDFGPSEQDDEVFPVSEDEKRVVREVLVQCIGDPVNRIRRQIAVLLGSIGGIEWPDVWPQLVQQIVGFMENASQRQDGLSVIDGSLLTLISLAEQAGLETVIRLNREVLPVALQILDANLQSHKLRGRTFHLLKSCVGSLKVPASVQGEESDHALQLIDELRVPLCRIIFTEIRKPYSRDTDIPSQQHALSILQILIAEHPKSIEPAVTTIIQELFQFLGRMREPFCRYVLLGEVEEETEGSHTHEADHEYDSEGEEHNMETVIEQALSVVCTIVGCTSKKVRKTLKGSVQEVLQGILVFMQLSAEIIEEWEDSSGSAALADGDSDSSLRQTGCELIGEIVETYGNKILGDVLASVENAMGGSSLIEAAKGNTPVESLQRCSWRLYESCFLVIGSIGPTLAKVYSETDEQKKMQKFRMDLVGFLMVLRKTIETKGSWLPMQEAMDLTTSNIVTARTLWCSGRLVYVLPAEHVWELLSVSVGGLGADEPLTVRLAACQTLARCLKKVGKENSEDFHNIVPTALDRIVNLLHHTNEDSMVTVLDTLRRLIEFSPATAAQHASQITSLLLALWIKCANDPVIGPATSDILSTLMANPDKNVPLVVSEKLLPLLNSILDNADDQTPGVRESSLEMLRCLINNVSKPVPPTLLNIFPSVAKYSQEVSTDDGGALQSICDTLASFVYAAPNEISQFNNGLQLLMEVLNKVLGPGPSDSGVLYSGKLVTAVVTKLGPTLGYEHLRSLIQAVLQRLGRSRLPSLIQAFDVSLAALIAIEPYVMINILGATDVSVIVGPVSLANVTTDGESKSQEERTTENGLVLFMRSTTEYLRFFQGDWEKKLCTLVLTQLVAMPEVVSKTENVVVNGDEIFTSARTRSQTRKQPKQYQKVTLPARVIMIILRSWVDLSSSEDDEAGSWDDDSEDDENEGNEDKNGTYSAFVDPDELVYLSDMLSGGNIVDVTGNGPLLSGGAFADDDDLDESVGEDDEEWAKEHPWYSVNTDAQLLSFFEFLQGPQTSAPHGAVWNVDLESAALPMLQEYSKEAFGLMTNEEKQSLQNHITRCRNSG